jgi:hypothetical protein
MVGVPFYELNFEKIRKTSVRKKSQMFEVFFELFHFFHFYNSDSVLGDPPYWSRRVRIQISKCFVFERQM